MTEFFTSGDIWSIIMKVLITALFSALLGLIGTLIGKIIANSKDSKIRKYAKTCVEAAEQKFPNQGKKMGPEKMQYVMDQLAIKFPKIKENTYLYNIAEAAVLQLNKDLQREKAIKEFEEKYGEKPLAVIEEEKNQVEISSSTEKADVVIENSEQISTIDNNSVEEVKVEEKPVTNTTKKKKSLVSF